MPCEDGTMTERRAPFHAILPCLAIALSSLAVEGAAAQTKEDERRYRTCLLQIRENASLALKTAEEWRAQGGGTPALHCVAMALLAGGNHQEAGVRLEALADILTEERADLRPEVLAQAAQAWLFAGQPERALKALDRAIALKANDSDLVIDRAVIHANAGRLAEAERDLDRALAMVATRDDALALRAAIRRKQGRLDEARADAERAVALNAMNAEAWLERGLIRHAKGDKRGAEEDWRHAMQAAPDSAAAKAAAQNLRQTPPKP